MVRFESRHYEVGRKLYDLHHALAADGLTLDHLAIHFALVDESLKEYLAAFGFDLAVLDRQTPPEYAFRAVKPSRLTRATGVPLATLRRRLEDLAARELVKETDGGWKPIMDNEAVRTFRSLVRPLDGADGRSVAAA